MRNTEWVLLDTETTGFCEPVCCVELAAQRMRGVDPWGPAFRVFINPGVDIEAGAVRVHGYTRVFLESNGTNPRQAFLEFKGYAGNLPLVSYNLPYDLGRVIERELERHGVEWMPERGFCAMALARHCLPKMHSHRLDVLCAHYFPELDADAMHSASVDLDATVRLLREVLWPMLEAEGVRSFADVCAVAAGSSFPRRRVVAEMPAPLPQSQQLAGVKFVLTGELGSMSREAATARIEAAGGRVCSSVSKKTGYVVAGCAPGAKLDRARELGIPVLTEAEFIAMLENGNSSTMHVPMADQLT